MRYDLQLAFLENKGINYHRIVANFILENFCKSFSPNTASVLVYGDKDLLISYLLSKEYLIHVNNIGFNEPENTHRIKVVQLDSFPLEEYDLIIGLSCDKQFIQNCITKANNFFFIPEYTLGTDLNESAKNILLSRGIDFEETVLNSNTKRITAFYNFNVKVQ